MDWKHVILIILVTAVGWSFQSSSEINILHLVSGAANESGLAPTEGPLTNLSAYKLKPSLQNFLPISNTSALVDMLQSDEGFTFLIVYKQHKNNLGTFMSLNSPGRLTPNFLLSSNSKTSTIMLKYRRTDTDKTRQLEWNLPKANHKIKSPKSSGWSWLSVSVDSKNAKGILSYNCHASKIRKMKDRKILLPADSLMYFGQEPGRKKRFMGSIQLVKLWPTALNERPWACKISGDQQMLTICNQTVVV